MKFSNKTLTITTFKSAFLVFRICPFYLNMIIKDHLFGKTMEKERKLRNIKLVTTEKRRNYLVSEPNYHIIKFFTENVSAIEMKKLKH